MVSIYLKKSRIFLKKEFDIKISMRYSLNIII